MSTRSVLDPFWELATASPAEAAAALDMPYESVLDAIGRGEIPHVRFGRRIAIKVQELKAHLGADQ